MPGEDSKACCFHVDGSRETVLFGQRDGTLSKYNLFSAVPVEQTRRHKDAITQLAGRDGSVLSCSEDGFVYKYEVDSINDVELLQRLSAPIRTVDISANGQHFLIAGDQMDLDIVNYADPIEMVQLEGHSHRIVCGRFDSTSSWIATLSFDNSCIIWKHTSSTAKWENYRKIDVNVKESKRANSTLSLSWSPSQPSVVAIPSESRVLLYDAVQGSKVSELPIPKLRGFVNHLGFSPNGNYLGVCSEHQLFLYSFCHKTLHLLKEFTDRSVIGILWLSEEFCYLGFDNCTFEKISVNLSENSLAITPDEPPAKRQAISYNEDSLEDLIEKMAQDDSTNEEIDAEVDELPVKKSEPADYFSAQCTFMPNCTPFVNNYRFLAWNNLGFVQCRQDDSKSKIDVEFFEAEKYRPIRFIDTNGLSMASLGSKGVLFASEYFDDANPSVVKFVPYESWAPNSDWTFTVPNGESIILIAMAKKWVSDRILAFSFRLSTLMLSFNSHFGGFIL